MLALAWNHKSPQHSPTLFSALQYFLYTKRAIWGHDDCPTFEISIVTLHCLENITEFISLAFLTLRHLGQSIYPAYSLLTFSNCMLELHLSYLVFPRYAFHFLSAWDALPVTFQHIQITLFSKAQLKCYISSSAAVFPPGSMLIIMLILLSILHYSYSGTYFYFF